MYAEGVGLGIASVATALCTVETEEMAASIATRKLFFAVEELSALHARGVVVAAGAVTAGTAAAGAVAAGAVASKGATAGAVASGKWPLDSAAPGAAVAVELVPSEQ